MKRLCAICGIDDKELIYRQELVAPAAKSVCHGYDVVACRKCGFVFADNTSSQAELDEYYMRGTLVDDAHTARAEANASGDGFEDPSHVRRHRNTVGNITPYARPDDRILDIGCGTGHILALLAQDGFTDLAGLEPSEPCRAIVREKYGLDVFVGTIFNCQQLGQFQFVILSHVLEHVVEVAPFLGRVFEITSIGGRVYVEVPDAIQFPQAARPEGLPDYDFGRDLFMQFTPEHVNFFTPTTLENLMSRFGFVTVACESRMSVLGVVAGVFEKRPPVVDTLGREKILDYVHASRELVREPLAAIDALLRQGGQFVIWGAGLHTQRMLACSDLRSGQLVAFVDSNRELQGKQLAERPIISPQELKSMPEIPVVISSRRLQEEIARQIRRDGFANPVIRLYTN